MAWSTPRTWVAAEFVTSAMMNTDVRDNALYLKTHGHDIIEAKTLAAIAASVTFTVPSGYRDLLISYQARSDVAAADSLLVIQFNGDTGANYYSQRLHIVGTTLAGQEGIGTASPNIGTIAGGSAPAGMAGTGLIEIPNYAGSFDNQALGRTITMDSTASGGTKLRFYGVARRNTAAITSVLLKPAAGNFAVNSVFTMWGVGVGT